jgi:limonene-1,2-epoxide hydrolase
VADFVSTHSEVKIDIRRIAIDGAVAVVEWSWEDKENGTERRSQADDAIVIDFTVAGISRWREYIDTQTPAKLQETKESLGTSRD